ncbi:MAG: diaminopimelate epimerase [Candidatus Omnitrophica bacterium]|nr:diaminopimelate epimerase [Candidatus Omnitrophota bacterium]
MIFKYNINFTKAVATGNDFIILDDKDGRIGKRKLDYAELARDLCRRSLSVGADGILVLEGSKKSDFRMRIFNPDGSEADMCGNGARCSSMYASLNGWGDTLKFETGAGIIKAEVKGGNIKLKMSDPSDIRLGIAIDVLGCKLKINFVNTGVPHTVVLVEDLNSCQVKETGRAIREHAYFTPEGTNVNFVEAEERGKHRVRTYERGVEDETLACGTGSVASAIILYLRGKAVSPVKMLTKSGETLVVCFRKSGKNRVKDVYLEGPAQLVYEGRV